jgi:hypothetical protein
MVQSFLKIGRRAFSQAFQESDQRTLVIVRQAGPEQVSTVGDEVRALSLK